MRIEGKADGIWSGAGGRYVGAGRFLVVQVGQEGEGWRWGGPVVVYPADEDPVEAYLHELRQLWFELRDLGQYTVIRPYCGTRHFGGWAMGERGHCGGPEYADPLAAARNLRAKLEPAQKPVEQMSEAERAEAIAKFLPTGHAVERRRDRDGWRFEVYSSSLVRKDTTPPSRWARRVEGCGATAAEAECALLRKLREEASDA